MTSALCYTPRHSTSSTCLLRRTRALTFMNASLSSSSSAASSISSCHNRIPVSKWEMGGGTYPTTHLDALGLVDKQRQCYLFHLLNIIATNVIVVVVVLHPLQHSESDAKPNNGCSAQQAKEHLRKGVRRLRLQQGRGGGGLRMGPIIQESGGTCTHLLPHDLLHISSRQHVITTRL